MVTKMILKVELYDQHQESGLPMTALAGQLEPIQESETNGKVNMFDQYDAMSHMQYTPSPN